MVRDAAGYYRGTLTFALSRCRHSEGRIRGVLLSDFSRKFWDHSDFLEGPAIFLEMANLSRLFLPMQ